MEKQPGEATADKINRTINFQFIENVESNSWKITGNGKDAITGKLKENSDIIELHFKDGFMPEEIEQALNSTKDKLQEKISSENIQARNVELYFSDRKNHPQTELSTIKTLEHELKISLEQLLPVIFDWVKVIIKPVEKLRKEVALEVTQAPTVKPIEQEPVSKEAPITPAVSPVTPTQAPSPSEVTAEPIASPEISPKIHNPT